MNKELKIKVKDLDTMEKRLASIGASFLKETTSTYKYFKQPKGRVWKITQNDEGVFETVLKRAGKNFTIIKNEPVNNPQKLEDFLTKKFKTSKKLVNVRRIYKYKNLIITTNEIDGLGSFVILEGQNPTNKNAQEILGIKEPEIVTKPFDQL